MEGDLTLQLISRAAASGLLYNLRLDPLDIKDRLCLRYLLDNTLREVNTQYSSRELLVSLVSKICMAIGNRDQFKQANESMINILHYLRGLDFPEKKKDVISKEDQAIMDLWEQVFGDPEEMERKFALAQAKAGVGDSEIAAAARERQQYVRQQFLRR